MLKFRKIAAICILALGLFTSNTAKAKDVPFEKCSIGAPFTYFDLEDVYHQRWVSTYLRGKPVILLAGHKYLKYEILKWAESFRQEYYLTGKAHVLWINNLRGVSHNTGSDAVYQSWRTFNSSVPVLLDWDGIIGKSLRINYNVPNIILLDAYGRLIMHEYHSYDPNVYAAVSAKIRPYCVNSLDLTLQRKKQKKGRKGDSF